jgi:putative transposase
MGRELRVQVEGGVNHVFSRGTGGCRIFREGADRERFLEILAVVAERYAWRVHFFCVLGTHFHLLFTTEKANLADGMRDLLGTYCRWFNRKYGRRGHLVERRYSSVLVESEAHAHRLIPYLSLNPVRAGVARRPEDWPWSSYAALVGKAAPRPFVDDAWLLEQLDSQPERARRLIRELVEEELELDRAGPKPKPRLVLGSPAGTHGTASLRLAPRAAPPAAASPRRRAAPDPPRLLAADEGRVQRHLARVAAARRGLVERRGRPPP